MFYILASIRRTVRAVRRARLHAPRDDRSLADSAAGKLEATRIAHARGGFDKAEWGEESVRLGVCPWTSSRSGLRTRGSLQQA